MEIRTILRNWPLMCHVLASLNSIIGSLFEVKIFQFLDFVREEEQERRKMFATRLEESVRCSSDRKTKCFYEHFIDFIRLDSLKDGRNERKRKMFATRSWKYARSF